MNCYLIDNNGFILVSEDYTQVSEKFLPALSKELMMCLGYGGAKDGVKTLRQ